MLPHQAAPVRVLAPVMARALAPVLAPVLAPLMARRWPGTAGAVR